MRMKTIFEGKPQDIGYQMFFTNTSMDEEVIAMRYARATNNFNALMSDPLAMQTIKDDYIAGPMHFAKALDKTDNHIFFDVDLKNAYPSWLLNYAKGNFNYTIGGQKEYYDGTSFFTFNRKGLRLYKIRFIVKTDGRENSRLYRRWFLKTKKIKNMVMTEEYIGGTISLPDIDDLVNRFLKEVQYYDDHDIVIDSIVVSNGKSNVFINKERLEQAIRLKNDPNNPYSDYYKNILNTSTGYLSHADKIMYYTMVNQIRMEIFKLWDKIDRWNLKRPDLPISIVAANTDGVTIYADKSAIYAIRDILNFDVNPFSLFTFDIKKTYEFDEARFTPNDVRGA